MIIHMQEENNAMAQVQSPQDREKEVAQLQHWLEHFAGKYKIASFRKSRYEDLMRRKSAKKWNPEKTARMVRRLLSANKEVEQSETMLERCRSRLHELGIDVMITSRSDQTNRANEQDHTQ